MSVNYAAGLSPYENKGTVGTREYGETAESLEAKVEVLADLIRRSQHFVVNTGAGVSTAAGIPDFRGPKGVWTLEKEGKRPDAPISFSSARPTFTHRALVALERSGRLKFLISQNVDGLHMRSGFPRERLAELHGNMFVEACERCGREAVRAEPVPTLGLKRTGTRCSAASRELGCRGHMRDTILDWEDSLPEHHLRLAQAHSRAADLNLVLGSSLQIQPANEMPRWAVRNGGSLVTVNLQRTKLHARTSLVIHARVDDVMRLLCRRLDLHVPEDDGGVVVVERSLHPAVPLPDHRKQRKRKSDATPRLHESQAFHATHSPPKPHSPKEEEPPLQAAPSPAEAPAEAATKAEPASQAFLPEGGGKVAKLQSTNGSASPPPESHRSPPPSPKSPPQPIASFSSEPSTISS